MFSRRRKIKTGLGFIYGGFLVWAICFPSADRISREKVFSIFCFQGLTAFCHFIFFLQIDDI